MLLQSVILGGERPVFGTYGPRTVEDLRAVSETGMNLVIAGRNHLDPDTPEGAYCLDHGIGVLYHMTSLLYHGVRLREQINERQTTIPLLSLRGIHNPDSQIVQIDHELIRYEAVTESELRGCTRGFMNTQPATHREGVILVWPQECAAEVRRVKDSPNLSGYYVLDDSPGDAVSALRALYQVIRDNDANAAHPVCAGFGGTGALMNLAPGVCDMLLIYLYPATHTQCQRARMNEELRWMLADARRSVPNIPFIGVYQAFDGTPLPSIWCAPTADQLREQLEDFLRAGASGLIAFTCRSKGLLGWADLPDLKRCIEEAGHEIGRTGGLALRSEALAGATPDTTGYVPGWYVLAPFDDPNRVRLEATLPPDKGIDLNAVYPGKTGLIRWRPWRTIGGVLSLTAIFGSQRMTENCVAYAVCDVTCTSRRSAQMRFASDDDALVCINDSEVFRHAGVGSVERDRDIRDIVLPAGTSRIVVKICNRTGMWGMFMRFTALDGTPLEGLTFEPTGVN